MTDKTDKVVKELHDSFSDITINCTDPKKSFGELSLARCSVMAHESLDPPETFRAFVKLHNRLIAIRRLQNKLID